VERLRCCAALLGLALLALASPAQGAISSTGFEGGLSGWEATGLWRVQDHPELVTVSSDIAGRLSDVPPGSTLPAAFDGTHAAWFGDPASGTYCAGFASVHQHPSNGCTSDGVVTGTLTSPAFALAPGAASLSFEAWWEISGGSPDLTDLMLVDYSTDGGATWVPAGSLNPSAPPWGSLHQEWSAAGHKGSGEWRAYTVDLTPAAGSADVRVRFRFDSVDEYGQGFRGLLVDNVAIADSAEPVTDLAATDAAPSQLIAGIRIANLASPAGGPVRGRSVALDPQQGSVSYTLPGALSATPLTHHTLVPVGTSVDTSGGQVGLTTATDDVGGTQTGSFHGGLFQIQQQPGQALVGLALRGGSLPHCQSCARVSTRFTRVHGIRHLWGTAHGAFRTIGHYASATVRGTNWLVEDQAGGTLVSVRSGSVLVNDRVLGRDVVLNAGQSYFARALFTNKQAKNPRFQRQYSLLTTRDGRLVHVYQRQKVVVRHVS
jgi:hypothetical protein